MRRFRWRLIFAGSLTLAALAGAACVDLFHSTQFDTLCDLDASACATLDGAAADTTPPAVPDAAKPSPPSDFCVWTSDFADRTATHACALLGACEGPLGNNQFGTCVVNARLAYDCAVNRNRPVRGATQAYWACLAIAETCEDVDACMAPDGVAHPCGAYPTPYAQCASGAGSGDGQGDLDTRIACDMGLDASAPRGVERCAATGQTCAVVDFGSCNGNSPACTDAGTACNGTHLADCDMAGGVDHGVDCANFGAGTCAPTGAACLAKDGSPECAVDASVTCVGARASSCPSGRSEAVDCAALLGDAGACNPKGDGRAWDVARGCTAGACAGGDTCSGTVLRSCARGVTFTVDCASIGLLPCITETLPTESVRKARCGKPRP